MASNFATVIQHVKIGEGDILALHTHVLGREAAEGEHERGNRVDYSWFQDIHNQELLVLVHQTMVCRAKESMAGLIGAKRPVVQFKRGCSLRALLTFKPSTAGHILIPKGGNGPSAPAPCVMFITEYGRRVMPFLQTFTASGSGFSFFKSLSEDLHAYVDPYEVTSPNGVVKLASVIDPSHVPSLDITAYFTAPTDSEADKDTSDGGEGVFADVPVAGLRRHRGGGRGRKSGRGAGGSGRGARGSGRGRKKAVGRRDAPPKKQTTRGGGGGGGGGKGRQSTIAAAFKTSVQSVRAAEDCGVCESMSELVGCELTASDVNRLSDFSSQETRPSKTPVVNLIDDEEEERADSSLRREHWNTQGLSKESKTSPTAEIIQNDFDSFFEEFDSPSNELEHVPPPHSEGRASDCAVPWDNQESLLDTGLGENPPVLSTSMEMDSTDMLLFNCSTPSVIAAPSPSTPSLSMAHNTQTDILAVTEGKSMLPQSPSHHTLADITNSPRKSSGSSLVGTLGSRSSSGDSDLVTMATPGSNREGKKLRSSSNESGGPQQQRGGSEFSIAVSSEVPDTASDVIMVSSGEEGGGNGEVREEEERRRRRRMMRMRGSPEEVFQGKSDVRELTGKEIKRWMFLEQDTIFGIFKGTVHSWRHKDYTSNPKKRAALHYQLGARMFTDEQTDLIAKELLRVFCSRHMKFFSYVMSVLYPEVLTRLVAGVHKVSFQEAERIMYSCPSAPTPTSSDFSSSDSDN